MISDADISVVTATFDEGRIIVRVPRELAHSWATTDQIGISAVQTISDGDVLKLLIEKDLECIDAPPDESQEDAFARSEPSKCQTAGPGFTAQGAAHADPALGR